MTVTKDIEVTKQEIASRFARYNQMYFGGRLGRCRFSYQPCFYLGMYQYFPEAKGRPRSKITINSKVCWTDETLRTVIVHEMVHMYTRTVLNVRYDGVFNHGIRFKRECRRLKRDFGIVITTNGYDLHYLKNTPYPKLWERVLQFLLDT